MKKKQITLPDDLAELKKLLLQKDEEIAALQAEISSLYEKFNIAQQKQFGKSSEVHPGHGEVFNEAEVEVADEAPAAEPKKKPKRRPLPVDLPRDEKIHDINESDKTCTCCGGELHEIDRMRSEKLVFIPAQIKVVEHVRLKYGCRCCDNNGINSKIKIAPVPASPIPKGIATSSLLSQIVVSKYQYGLPLYRQESMFEQHGISLSRKTMSDWMIKCSALLTPLVRRLQDILLQQPVIHADETPLTVIREDKVNCYMWVYCSGSDALENQPDEMNNIVLFDYQNSRAGSCPVDYLQGYNGYLQVDGYAGYNKTEATKVGCMAHARRKFVEAETAQPKGKVGKANWALNHIQKLYRIEKEIKKKTALEKHKIRQEKSLPLLDEFKRWLDKSSEQVPPKSAVGKAISYSLKQWSKLVRYIDDGHLSIDNNRAERAVKPFVIGRKNWLFSNTGNGATSSAVLYSVIETAKANGLVPFEYLMHCLEHLSSTPERVDEILPWNYKNRSV
ncbi:MAG: IS66 family transposase [Planctomycetes bacterium]|nr:IS66 family transposase [Planctomycetota bacterium]